MHSSAQGVLLVLDYEDGGGNDVYERGGTAAPGKYSLPRVPRLRERGETTFQKLITLRSRWLTYCISEMSPGEQLDLGNLGF